MPDTVRPATAGLLAGTALGFAAAFGGLEAFVVVLVLAVVGYVAGRVIEGSLDLTDYLGGRARRDR